MNLSRLVAMVQSLPSAFFPRPVVPALRIGISPILIGASLVALGQIGCSGRPQREMPSSQAAGHADVAAQMAAVREGRSDAIHVVDRILGEADWRAIGQLTSLRVLVVERGRAEDRHLTMLAELPRLERLVLRGSPVGDDGLRAIAGCPTLRDLNIPQSICSAEGVASLAGLPHLHALRIGSRELEGLACSRALVTFPRLRSLHLIDVAIGDEGLDILAGLQGLENLYLDGAGVSDTAWERYCQTRPAVHVHVDQRHHDRDPARHDH